MPSTESMHPYDTRYKYKIRPSLNVEKPVKKPPKKKCKRSQDSEDAQVISQEPLEIGSDAPSPLSSSDNAASPEPNDGEIDNDNDDGNDNDDENDIEAVTAAGADPGEDPATIYNNPQPVNYGHTPGYVP